MGGLHGGEERIRADRKKTEVTDMATVLAFAQQKGGTGKTTTAAATAAILAEEGASVIALDLDAQSNLSFIMGADVGKATILDALQGKATVFETIQDTGKKYGVIPATPHLAGADMFLKDAGALARTLKPLRGRCDYIIIDTPPALGILTINAFNAADYLVIPCLADTFSIQATATMAETISAVKGNGGAVKVAGILITHFNARQIITRDTTALLQRAAKQMGTKVFDSRIREGVAVREAQALQRDLTEYAPKATTAADYISFVKELKMTIAK